MAAESRTPNGFLTFLGSLAALVLVGALLVWSIAVGPKPQDLDTKRSQQRSATRERLEKEAHDNLTTAGWVDKDKGVARVPVVSVFAATAEELKNKKPKASQVKVEAPLPMPVIDPNATEPPPLALPSAPQGADTMHFRTLQPADAAPATPVAATPAANPAPPAPTNSPPPAQTPTNIAPAPTNIAPAPANTSPAQATPTPAPAATPPEAPEAPSPTPSAPLPATAPPAAPAPTGAPQA